MISYTVQTAFSSIRIIAGQLKGRKVPTLQGQNIRPTSLRAREALFSILGTHVQGASIGDFFAGSGAVGLEALSRGAAKVVFIEHHPEAGLALQQTVEHFNLSAQSLVLVDDVPLAIQNPILVGWRPFDILFVDPPYRMKGSERMLEQIEQANLLTPQGRLIFEHFSKSSPPPSIGKWGLTRTAKYGDTALSFYQFHPTYDSLR